MSDIFGISQDNPWQPYYYFLNKLLEVFGTRPGRCKDKEAIKLAGQLESLSREENIPPDTFFTKYNSRNLRSIVLDLVYKKGTTRKKFLKEPLISEERLRLGEAWYKFEVKKVWNLA